MISTEQIKALREKTGVSIAQCKKALEESGGDIDKALSLLQQNSSLVASKKSDRELAVGLIASYVHGGVIGSMVEMRCETDFVSKNQDFKELADDLAMQITAMNPQDNEELLAQPAMKNPDLTISQLIDQAVQKFGERIEVSRFARFDSSES